MKPVAVSKFADVAFCELKLVHHFVEGTPPEFHPCVFQGARQHAESAREDGERGHVSVPAGELLSALGDGESEVEFPAEAVKVEFSAYGLDFFGRLDKLVKRGGEAVVIDEKFTSGKGECFRGKYEAQLSAYAFGLANGRMSVGGVFLGEKVFFGKRISCRVLERDIESRRHLGGGQSFEYCEAKLLPLLARFKEIVGGGLSGKELACGCLEKCVACEFRHACGERAY